MKKIHLLLILILIIPSMSLADAEVSGLVSYVFKNSDNNDNTNVTFRNFSNFHSTRARLFFDANAGENIDVFTQILMDTYSFQLYGAYVRVSHIGGSRFGANIGYIPHPVGAWGPRTYSDANPLIGVPLVYNMHSSYMPGGPTPVNSVDNILALRSTRSSMGLPVIYDACWNVGAELFYANEKLFWSVGLIAGSLSKPSIEQSKDIPQVTTHLTYMVNPRVTLGFSAFFGPYLFEGAFKDTLPSGKDYDDYLNGGIGYELHYEGRFFDIYSESFYTYWEHPYLPKLTLIAGYIEGKYKFSPGWFVAGRFDFYEPGSLTDSFGNDQKWDYPVRRVEAGLGYRPTRSMTVKLVTQQNNYLLSDELDDELYALQIVTGF